MKKITSIAVIILSPFFAIAQDRNFEEINRMNMEAFRICATIFMVGIFMIFILAILKKFLEHRLKNKIIEKGIPESISSSILQSSAKEDGNANVKWFALLAGLGAGLTIVNYTQPLGIHSLAIMAFCISASFLGYYFFTRSSQKQ